MNELDSLLTLTFLPHLGAVKIRLLLEHYGSASLALKAPLAELALFPGFGPRVLESWKKGADERAVDKNHSLIDKLGAKVIPYDDSRYPKALLECPDHPILLYVKGEMEWNEIPSLAVIGTRQATIYGQEMAKVIAEGLSQAGYIIVSGLARGIDTLAHQGALRYGKTIAILGSGLGSIYPAENSGLAHAITQKGALISEFPMMASPDKQHFPQRNRLVSGMTKGTIVIEAPMTSGSMLTARKAVEQKRPLFALPGRVDHENYRGNHHLIKSGEAKLIEGVADVLAHYQKNPVKFSFLPHSRFSIPLEKEEEQFFLKLPSEEFSVEELSSKAALPINQINILLMSLVLKKALKEYPGKIYKKV